MDVSNCAQTEPRANAVTSTKNTRFGELPVERGGKCFSMADLQRRAWGGLPATESSNPQQTVIPPLYPRKSCRRERQQTPG